MKLRQQRSLSFGLLIAFLLQSCGIEIPVAAHLQPEEAELASTEQSVTTLDGVPSPLSTETLRVRSGTGERYASDNGSTQWLSSSGVAFTRDRAEPGRVAPGDRAAQSDAFCKASYDDLLQGIRQGKALSVVNETISLLYRLAAGPDARASIANQHIAQLREDLGLEWHSTTDGKSVTSRLMLVVEEWGYVQELQQISTQFAIYASTDARNNLAEVLRQLALLHQAQGTDLGDLGYYTDAAMCYQYLLSVCKGEEWSAIYQYPVHAAYAGLLKIRKGLAAVSMDIAQLQEEIAMDKQELQRLRDDAQLQAAELEALLNPPGTLSSAEETAHETAYIQGSRDLFYTIATKVRAFLARLYRESEEELGPPPCKYTVMGLGSMALE